MDILRGSLFTYQDDLFTRRAKLFGFVRSEDDLADAAARPGRKAGADFFRCFLRLDIYHGVEQFFQLFRPHTADGRLLGDETFLHHVNRHLDGCRAVSFPHPGLQHIQDAMLNGELDVLHIRVMGIQLTSDVVKLLVDFWHGFLKGWQVPVCELLGDIIDSKRGADTGHHIFSLGVDQPFSVEVIVAGSRVAGEGDSRCAIIAHIAKDHGLDIHSRSPVIREPFNPAVGHGTLAKPRQKDRIDGPPKLFHGIIRERFAKYFSYCFLKFYRE